MAGGSVTAAFCLRMGFFPVGAGRVRTRQRCMCAGAHGPLAAIGDPKYAWNPDGLVARRISVLLREGINCLCVLAALDLIAGVILCPRNRPRLQSGEGACSTRSSVAAGGYRDMATDGRGASHTIKALLAPAYTLFECRRCQGRLEITLGSQHTTLPFRILLRRLRKAEVRWGATFTLDVRLMSVVYAG